MTLNPTIVMTWIVALAWIFLIIEWLDILRQFFAVRARADDEPDLSTREAAKTEAESLTGDAIVVHRLRNLLLAWSNGADPREVVALSSAQSNRMARRLAAVGFFMALVFTAGLKLSIVQNPAWLGLGLVGATVFAKSLVLGRIDNVIESILLIRLPPNLPGMGVTAGELGMALGGTIEQSFKNYMPQPEKLAAVVGDAVERGRKAAAESEKAAATVLDAARKAIEGLSSQLTSGLAAHTEKVQSVLGQHSEQWAKAATASGSQLSAALTSSHDKLQSVLAQHAEQFGKASSAAGGQIGAALNASNEKLQQLLTQHADQIGKSSQALSGQLDRIMALEKEIDKVLHVQQSVDGAIRSVTAAEEFKQMLSALRGHLQESDKLLREVARPRTIRLVESEES